MRIKKFNESDEYERLQPKVKHLIEYLSTLDPEMNVSLDKDGWQGYGDTELDIVKTSGLFDVFQNTLIINN
jgi:hypothetical protein